MEQRGILLDGIARVLNAGGSALLNVYDAVTAFTTAVLPGEKGSLSAQLREYEKKIERLYCEIGKEVVLREDTAHLSMAGEAGIKRVAEYQTEITKIKQRIQLIEAEEKAAAAAKKEALKARAASVKTMSEPKSKTIADKEALKESTPAKVKTAPELTADVAGAAEPEVAEESAVTELPEDSSVATEAVTEATADVSVEAAGTPASEIAAVAAEAIKPGIADESIDNAPDEVVDIFADGTAAPVPEIAVDPVVAEESIEAALEEATDVPGETGADALSADHADAETKEAATTEELEEMLKTDLLTLCKEKGIEADKRMTKAEIIELIVGRS
ncbi:MAG: hypothetical protein WCJ37_00970 [Syntrophus sp. (in: bacteria)]